MKKIILIGDSIRMGYDKYVKEALEGTAELFYPEENSKFATYILRFAHEWKSRGKWPSDVDLIHWNAGLWDVIEMYGDGPLTPIEYYAQTIKRVDKRLRLLFPDAKIVFATSTAVLEEKCHPQFKRYNATIDAYNKAAIDALSDTDTVINDLFAVTQTCPEEYHSDAVHYYTDQGLELIGGKVLGVLCNELSIAAESVNLENFTPEKYSKTNIGY